jgi:hypothetical protein
MKNPLKGESNLYQVLTYLLFGGMIVVALMYLCLAVWRVEILLEQLR